MNILLFIPATVLDTRAEQGWLSCSCPGLARGWENNRGASRTKCETAGGVSNTPPVALSSFQTKKSTLMPGNLKGCRKKCMTEGAKPS